MIISFFRDVLDGPLYFLYVFLCITLIFAHYGVIADRKREVIENGLKEKKKRDIESGKEAQIAAMESKQVLDVMKDKNEASAQNNGQVQGANNQAPNPVGSASSSADIATKKEEVPQTLVIGSSGN